MLAKCPRLPQLVPGDEVAGYLSCRRNPRKNDIGRNILIFKLSFLELVLSL